MQEPSEQELEGMELKEIHGIYKGLFGMEPPLRKNKHLMVRAIVKHRVASGSDGGTVSETSSKEKPTTKAVTRVRAKSVRKAQATAGSKAKTRAAPKAKSGSKAKEAPQAKTTAKATQKTTAASKTKPKSKSSSKGKASSARTGKGEGNGQAADEAPGRTLRGGKRKNYREDTPLNVDSVGRMVKKHYNGQTFEGYVTEVSLEAGLATVRWQDGSDERLYPDSLQEALQSFDEMVGRKLILDGNFAAEVLNLIEVTEDSLEMDIVGYVPESRGYTMEAKLQGQKVTGSIDFVYLGPYLMMQALPRPAAPPGETSSLDWDEEDELSVCIFCYGISSSNGPATLRCPKWATVLQLKNLINQRVGGTLPERRQRLSTFSEGMMRVVGPEKDGPGALISNYGITNMEEDNHVVLELLPDALDGHQKKVREYHKILAGFKLSVDEMVAQRAQNRRVRQKTVRADISGNKREYGRWTEEEVTTLLDECQKWKKGSDANVHRPMSKMYEFIAKSKKLSQRSADDVKTKVVNLRKAIAREGGRDSMRQPISEKNYKRARLLLLDSK